MVKYNIADLKYLTKKERQEDVEEVWEKLKNHYCCTKPSHVKDLKLAYEAYDRGDRANCRKALIALFENMNLVQPTWFNPWTVRLRNLLKLRKMLKYTELGQDQNCKTAYYLYSIIEEPVLARIPANLKLAYKNNLHYLTPGITRMLQKYKNDPADDELWEKINNLMARNLDAEAQTAEQQ